MSVSTAVTPYRLISNSNKYQFYNNSSDDEDDECIVNKTSGDFASSYPCDAAANKQMMEAPQPTASQSTSRLKNAFQRLRGNSVSIAPAEIIKPTPSKSSSLAEKIKIKFQYNKKMKKTEHRTMMRSTSFSNAWSKWGATKPPMVRSTSVYPQQQQQEEQSIMVRKKSHRHHKRKVSFAKLVSVRETFSRIDYDRVSDPYAICNRLTPVIAQQIKEELNAYKLHEMQVHEYSRIHTHFFI
ncbi:hypothetical protein K501DRAFT_337302 [Backusella circina FSU 941]|nr:hypothetical protein K501DRAFT_337302 [Backusella circina FSU 941]